MKYKAGQLVILSRGTNPVLQKYIGSIRTLKVPCTVYRHSWDVDPPVIDHRGMEASWDEKDMIPINDNDGEDEMIRIAGKPQKEIA